MSLAQRFLRVVLALYAIALLTGAAVKTFEYVRTTDPAALDGMYDIYRYFGPITFLVDYSIHAGEFPLWNPITYCGMPMTGNPQSFLFYIPHLVRALFTVDPSPAQSNFTLAVMWGLHFIFMGFCTYLLGRAHKLSFTGALTAAIAFMCSALMVRRMGEYHFITTMAWLPLLLLLIKKMIDTEEFFSKMGIAVLAGLTLAMSFTGGYLQIANLAGFVPALYALFYFLLNIRWGQHRATLYDWVRPWLHNGMAMAVIFLLGVAVAAVTLLPAWELSAFSLRSVTPSLGKFSDLWKWTPLEFYQKMVLYCGIKYEAETIRNAGVAALLLACAALTHRNRRDVFMFAGMYLVLLECCFGPPLPIGALLERVTPFSLSAYSRAYDYALLPLALLSGFGVDAMSQPLKTRGRSYARAVMLILIACVCISPMSGWIKEITYVKVSYPVILIPIGALLLMLLTGTIRLNRTGRAFFGLLLAALVFWETYAWNQSFVPYLTRKKVTDVVAVKESGHTVPTTNYRETDPICNRFMYSLRFSMNGVDPAHLHEVRNLLSGPPREGPGLRGVKDFEPTQKNTRGNMLFKRSFWLARQYATGALPGKREYFPAATTVFLEAPIDAPVPQADRQALPRSAVSDHVQVTDITAPASLFTPTPAGKKRTLAFTVDLPKAVPGLPEGSAGAVHSTLVYAYTAAGSAQVDLNFSMPGTDRTEMGLQNITRPTGGREMEFEVPLPDFPKLNAQIIVQNKGQGDFTFTRMQIKSDLNDEDGLIKIASRTLNTATLQVGPLSEPRILTFLDSWYPGWKAYVDGEEVPILLADERFKAVALSPGTHEVHFAFKPLLTLQALIISLVSLGGALLLLLLCWRYRLPGVSSDPREHFSLEMTCDGNGRLRPVAFSPSTPVK
ncbi:MAG: hypothetical protein GXY07_06490 [Candidatus Hydrogenedentes bacterium]|nr:hypothetical protein [Candidatus Hydrogenedentota bacterium]